MGGWSALAAVVALLAISTPVARLLGHRPLVGLAIGFGVITPLERRWTRHAVPIVRAGFRTDVLHFVLTHPLRLVCTAASVGTCYVVLDPVVIAPTQRWVAGLNIWQTVLAAYLGVGIAYYFEHRAAHRWSWLWRFHAVHHSPTTLDWLAATRLHPLEGLLGGFILGPPLVLFGFEPSDLAIGAAAFGLADILIHANVSWRLRWLDGIVPTPEYHHWHHVSTPVRDVNFSLPFIDRLFGTYHMPADGTRPEIYGIDEALPDTYLGQLRWPLQRPRTRDGALHPREDTGIP